MALIMFWVSVAVLTAGVVMLSVPVALILLGVIGGVFSLAFTPRADRATERPARRRATVKG